jgi:hypothetical protein
MRRIPLLSELSIGHRIALTMAFVVVILFAMAFIGWISGGWEADAQAQIGGKSDKFGPLPPKGTFVGRDTPWDLHMLELDRKALDEAYTDQLMHLFAIWMKDDSGQPDRAITGARQARRAYILVMDEITKRELERRNRIEELQGGPPTMIAPETSPK